MNIDYKYQCAKWIVEREKFIFGYFNRVKSDESKFVYIKRMLIDECRLHETYNNKNSFWKYIEEAAYDLTYKEFIQILINNQYNKNGI